MPTVTSIWRPRFSVRTLAIVVTLVCVYFAAWEATKRYGLKAIPNGSVSPMPFIVGSDKFTETHSLLNRNITMISRRRQFHFWAFGFQVTLPLTYLPAYARTSTRRAEIRLGIMEIRCRRFVVASSTTTLSHYPAVHL